MVPKSNSVNVQSGIKATVTSAYYDPNNDFTASVILNYMLS